jgi:putative endonuclease
MFLVYILYSAKLDKYYVGYTGDSEQRLSYHNAGRVNFTSKGIPWALKYSENHPFEKDVIRREGN